MGGSFDWLSWLTALAAIALAVATGFTAFAAVASAKSAKLQWRRAAFEERFATYRLAKDALILASQTIDYPYDEIHRDLSLAIDRGKFLFPAEKIAILESWVKRLVRLKVIKDELESDDVDNDPEHKSQLIHERYDIARQADIASKSLHMLFFPHMDLRSD